MTKCTLCGSTLKLGRGKTFVKKSGEIFHFCNSKCQKNWEKRREGKSLKWTSKFEKGPVHKASVDQ